MRWGSGARAALLALTLVAAWPREGAAQAPVHVQKKYALIIGLNTYTNGWYRGKVPDLRWAADDATALEKTLSDLGYEVTKIAPKEVTRRRIITELNSFARKATERDAFLLYYAGHGLRNHVLNDKVYWLTWDSEPDELDPSGLRLSHLFDYVRDIKAGFKLILLDHCFAGELVKSLREASTGTTPAPAGGPAPPAGAPAVATGPAAPAAPAGGAPGAPSRGGDDGGDFEIARGVERLGAASMQNEFGARDSGTVILAAARDEAFELDSLKHGIFTYALIRALTTREADTNRDGALSIDELTTFLAATVKSVSLAKVNREQEVLDFTMGQRLGWFVAENLPVGSVQEAQAKVDAIRAMLTSWAKWMTPPTKTVCWQATDNWFDSVSRSTPLSATDDAVFRIVEAALTSTLGTEQVRAEMLHHDILPFTRP